MNLLVVVVVLVVVEDVVIWPWLSSENRWVVFEEKGHHYMYVCVCVPGEVENTTIMGG